jgi:PPM family protein phosphatase
MEFVFAGRTDRGRVRVRNEDALLLRPARGLFAVADGMGGHAGGDIASRLAVDVLDERSAALDNTPAALEASFHAAHQAVLDAARADKALAGMGTTLTALQVQPGGCAIVHVGDSRAYQLRGQTLVQLTRDQTWVQAQVDAGLLSPAQARVHPYSAMLTGALGIQHVSIEVQVVEPEIEPGDTFLLATDGLTARLTDDRLADILTRHPDLDTAAAELVSAANAAGGPDNVTVALVRFPSVE